MIFCNMDCNLWVFSGKLEMFFNGYLMFHNGDISIDI